MKDYVPFCNIQSKVEGEKHPNLRQELCGHGIPSVAFLDSSGRVILKCLPPHSVESFRKRAREVEEYLALRRKAEEGDPEAMAAFFVLQLRHEKYEYAEAKKKADRLRGFTEEQKKEVDGRLRGLEAREIARAAGRDPKMRREAGRKFLGWLREGRTPPEPLTYGFWYLILEYAEHAGDVDGFVLGCRGFRERHGDKPWAESYLKRQEAVLEKMKK